jgi:hypothetical protein
METGFSTDNCDIFTTSCEEVFKPLAVLHMLYVGKLIQLCIDVFLYGYNLEIFVLVDP